MKTARLFLFVLSLGITSPVAFSSIARVHFVDASHPASPPTAPVKPVTDVYYGIKVIDPYRYMEKMDDPEVQSWFKAQNDYTRAVLTSLPGRQQLLSRIVELDESAAADIGSLLRLPDD